eukprot:symbB.v1.2.003687.t1/scaffold193.1/size400748/6
MFHPRERPAEVMHIWGKLRTGMDLTFEDLRVAAQKALGRQASPRRRDPSPGPDTKSAEHMTHRKPPMPVRQTDGRPKSRKTVDGVSEKFLSMPEKNTETCSVGSHEGGALGPSIASVGTGVEDSSCDAEDEVQRLRQQVSSQQQRTDSESHIFVNGDYSWKHLRIGDEEKTLICRMKDAAEEERLAGIKRLNEGDFGDDLPLVIRACGFTTLELPNFDALELQTEEVVSLCANLVANPRSFDQWISLMKLVEAHGKDEEKRELYEHFLCEFPLCWGYWKRLADLQTRMGADTQSSSTSGGNLLSNVTAVEMSQFEDSPSASTSSTRRNRRNDGGLLQDEHPDTHRSATPDGLKDDETPAPGVILKLSEVSGCDLDTCCAALMTCDNNFHAALEQLRRSPSTLQVGAKERAQMGAALQMFERAPRRRDSGRLRGFLRPGQFETLFALLGVSPDSQCGLLALFLPVLIALLAVVESRGSRFRSPSGGAETGLNVYVKALKLAPACVDLWVHYCQTASVSWSSEDPEVEDGLRQIFEKAVETVGTDWRAFPLWDLYMNFEEKHGRWKRLGALLRRAMVIPMEGLPAVRIRLRALVVGDAAPALEELCCDDQEAELLDVEMKPPSDPQVFNVVLEDHLPKVENKNPEPKVVEKDEKDEKVVATAPILPVQEVEMEELEELSEGEICDDEVEVAPAAPASPVPPEDPPAPEEPKDSGTTKVEAMETTEPKKSKFITERTQRFLELREGLWAAASEEAARLRHFEAPLHRHYFHQKPLSSAQLDAWRRFLDFEESREPRDWRRLQVVFERCLIVTNNYLEFWLRYASWLQFAEAESGAATPEMACSLLRGACLSGRLSRRPDVFAAWAELEEACGRTGRARILLDATLSGCGHGSADVALRRAALELRHKDSELALVLLARYATDAVDLASKAVLSRRYAKLCEEMKQFEQAQRSLMLTWQAGCRDVGLLLELASLLMRMGTEEKGTDPSPLQQSCNLFEEALRCAQHDTASFTEACELWSCYVDFLLSHGAPLVQLRDVQARARAFRAKASVQISEKKKRGLQGPAFISAKQVKVHHGFETHAQGGSMVN